jgi:flagellar hook-associated protein 2
VTTTPTTTSTTASSGSSIISSLGSGSGIDSNALITKLVEVNKAPQLERLTTRQTLLETRISDFGLLRSAFSTLETAAAGLSNADTFNAKSASIPTTSLLAITKLDAKAAVGDYSITVDQIAQAQSISSGNFASLTTPIGKGTLAIRFGSWNAAVDTFTVDSAKTGGTITVDDSNNSLTGLRDSINKANLGVKASIVRKLPLPKPWGQKVWPALTSTRPPVT